jgi:hypothetical protein
LREILEALIALARLDVEVVTQPERLRVQDLKVLAGTAQALYTSTGWRATTPLHRTLEELLSYWRTGIRSTLEERTTDHGPLTIDHRKGGKDARLHED